MPPATHARAIGPPVRPLRIAVTEQIAELFADTGQVGFDGTTLPSDLRGDQAMQSLIVGINGYLRAHGLHATI